MRHEEEHALSIIETQARQHLTPEDFTRPRVGGDERVFTVFFHEIPDIFRMKVFDRTGRIVWSDERRLIGLAFPDDSYLRRALDGQTTVVIEAPTGREHVYERARRYVMEAYVPVRFPGGPEFAGVVETYKDASELMAGIQRAQRRIWGFASAAGLFLYLALAFVVRTAWRNERRAAEEVREAHERLAVILSAVTDRMMIIDRNMSVVWLNSAAAAGLGAGSAEPLGRPCFELLGGADSGLCQSCPAVRTLASGGVERGVRTERLENGDVRHFDLVTAPLQDAAGEVYQVLEVARDITEMAKMEERLKESAATLERSHAELLGKTQELEEAYRTLRDTQAQLVEKERLAAVGQVVVSLHHGILNPLAGILGALEVLKGEAMAPGSKAEMLAEAEAAIRRIERLLRQLLEVSNLKSTTYVGSTTMLDVEASRPDEPHL